ncbi:fibronectin type III domain-containing protein [Microbacterium sp. K36]|uniref:fibronectin type III domain-containing protein n=1 Tax=Microbacterium sp. K36 TaxID=2305439 RepID=UPI00144455ED|nr:fibronectin type III domain-containing protein [Microbacterium sp. K36]
MIRWAFELLDSEDRPLGALDGVTGGSGEIVAQSALGGSGSLSLDRRRDIDWQSHRVQCAYTDGERSWPVGTYLFTSPREVHTATSVSYEVQLLTKMSVIFEDTVEERFSLPAGTAIIQSVVALIESTGETRIAATASAAVLASGMTWEAGTTKLTVVNDLLQAAGYWSLWCDGSGLFRVEPYVDPANRPVSFEFTHGEASVHFPEWDREQDLTSVPNKFVAVTQGDETAAPLVGVATNENPASPYSYQARGRWITATEEGVEAASQNVIDQYAAKKLTDAMNPVSRMTATHAMLPLDPNDLIAFTPEDGVRRLATVQRMAFDFTFDTDIRAEWREVSAALAIKSNVPPDPTAVPAAPTLPTATTSTTTAALSWAAPSSPGGPIIGYDIEWAADPTFTGATSATSTTPSVTITGLTPGGTYSFRVRARNAAGPGEWSPARTETTSTGMAVNLTGPAGIQLSVPTHVSPSGGQTTHPSVVDFGAPWNGYRYWMAHTPYPGGNDAHEDPNIVASTDGTTWIVPSGLANPIDNQPGSPGAYNSDVDLVQGPDGQLWLFWRTYTASATGAEEKLYVSTSPNGTTWAPKKLIYQSSKTVRRLVSPAFIFESGAWTMYAIDIVGTPQLVRLRSTSQALSPSEWSAPTVCTVTPSLPNTRQLWHIEVRLIDGVYMALLNDCDTGSSGQNGDLWLMKSLNGTSFTKAVNVAVPRSATGHSALYRSAFTLRTATTLDVWYSGWLSSPSVVWNLFRTTLS